MRIGIRNLGRKEVRECQYAYVEKDILTLYLTGINLKLKFEFYDEKKAEEVLERLFRDGYYDFGNRDCQIEDLSK